MGRSQPASCSISFPALNAAEQDFQLLLEKDTAVFHASLTLELLYFQCFGKEKAVIAH